MKSEKWDHILLELIEIDFDPVEAEYTAYTYFFFCMLVTQTVIRMGA